ncbi:HEPN domain-containing protein [Methylosinus sp. Sm6]|uniref:HEPN domain-containing protein n=1 Tax=Methylosinus sp. Sm6 TaxID=2866948 RepID=UPI001C999090|nr:HEPN domain-containing protein [Methylosinus sp. Sm6]MBY6240683.1 HEPN domain-containing protein [Methylosinus sp. Sm6]
MQPETSAYLAKARQALKEARIVAANELPEAAGRAAYLAAFHAAQALIFERTSKTAKSHNGVRSEFARLAKNDPNIDPSFPTFLARAYNLKATADYAIGDGGGVSLSEAEQAIEIAVQLVDCVEGILARGA